MTPLEPLPLAGIGLFRFSTNPRRTDGVEVALAPLGDFVPGAFGGARVVFCPRVVPELLLGRDEVELVTLLLEVVRVKFKSELLSSDIVLQRASIGRATMLITYKRGSIFLIPNVSSAKQANTKII